jgi:hypothetical protein
LDDDTMTPGWLRDYRPIEVDLATLAEFAKALQDEVDLNFTPHMTRVVDALDPGADPFARKPYFPEINAAWYTYIDARDRAVNLLNAYRTATMTLARAADLIARDYTGSDAFAEARVADVQQAFSDAKKLAGAAD